MAGMGRFLTTAEWQAAVIAVLEDVGGIVSQACARVGIHKTTLYEAFKRDPDFRERFNAARREAIEASVDRAETELLRRAIEGTTKPVYQGGQHVGDIQEYSDTLLLAYLNAHAADRGYVRNANIRVSGPDGGPVRHEVATRIESMEDHERATLRKVIDEALAKAKDEPVAAS